MLNQFHLKIFNPRTISKIEIEVYVIDLNEDAPIILTGII